MVFNKPINELIAVQALNFRREWKGVLELITPDERRDIFFSEYTRLKNDRISITSQRELDAYSNEITDSDESSRYTRTVFAEIYQNLLKENTTSLNSFLDAGAYKILKNIKKMEEYGRALETTKLKPLSEQDGETGLLTIDPSKLLESSPVTVYKYEEFNSISLLLDTIWWQLLRDKIKPNTYDKKWCLKDLHSGKVFNDIGRDSNYAFRSGKRYDYRTLGEIGIRPSMHLLLIPPP